MIKKYVDAKDKLLGSSVEVCDRCGYGADKHGLFKLYDETLCWACFKDQEQKEEGDEW